MHALTKWFGFHLQSSRLQSGVILTHDQGPMRLSPPQTPCSPLTVPALPTPFKPVIHRARLFHPQLTAWGALFSSRTEGPALFHLHLKLVRLECTRSLDGRRLCRPLDLLPGGCRFRQDLPGNIGSIHIP
jgi:hypothetical protein